MTSVEIGALLVDDEPDVRLLLRKMIEAERMPAMGGMEAAALIMARRPNQSIVLCTAHLDDELRERAQAVGIASCVPKRDIATIPLLLKDLAKSA